MVSVKVSSLAVSDKKLGYLNKVFVHPSDFSQLIDGAKSVTPNSSLLSSSFSHDILVKVNSNYREIIFCCAANESVEKGSIVMNNYQRKDGELQLAQMVEVLPYDLSHGELCNSFTVYLDVATKKEGNFEIREEDFLDDFKSLCCEHFLHRGQVIAMKYRGNKKLKVTIGEMSPLNQGQLLDFTEVKVSVDNESDTSSQIHLSGGSGQDGEDGGVSNNLFKEQFDFEKLGIGGLTSEFNKIFRRAFASRIYPTRVVNELGIKHVRGMMLFGPPGCGKTLIARKIGQALNAREPRICNGPEVLNKYVGGSEEKIRELFAPAEDEQRQKGDNSMLHIIIFDEFDAICKKRGSGKDSTGTMDTIVNQLLSKMDGVESLNNILIIGMTNRLDMIDDAILRPGRMEVHVEIGLPDEKGRAQILNIHTKPMRESNRVTPDALEKLPWIASQTKNYSGAELEGLVKCAVSYALRRDIDAKSMGAGSGEKLRVTLSDFERALEEVVPRLGANNDELSSYTLNGIVPYGPVFDQIITTLRRLIVQVRESTRTPMMSALLTGPPMTGKTAIAASIAMESEFSFIQVITADQLVGYTESAKCDFIFNVFKNAHRCPSSILIFDDIERIIEYSPIGPRFSNQVLQTFLVLLKKPPTDPSKKLLVLATTSISTLLESLQLVDAFNLKLHVPRLDKAEEMATVLREFVGSKSEISEGELDKIANGISKPIGLKQLIMVTEMSRIGESSITYDRFMECLENLDF